MCFGHQALRGALLSCGVVGCGEDFGDAADPVLVHVVGRSVDVRRVVEIDKFGFGIEAEDLYPSRQGLVS